MTYLKSLNTLQFDNLVTPFVVKNQLYNYLYKLIDKLGIAASNQDKNIFNQVIAEQFLVLGLMSDLDKAVEANCKRIVIVEQHLHIIHQLNLDTSIL